jgi:hypothetical protein
VIYWWQFRSETGTEDTVASDNALARYEDAMAHYYTALDNGDDEDAAAFLQSANAWLVTYDRALQDEFEA